MFYAIGDIHGRLVHLKEMYTKILADIDERRKEFGEEENTIVFLGDYIDRGPSSLAVIDFLSNLRNTRELTHVFLKGNHEQMYMEALTGVSGSMPFLPLEQRANVIDMWLNQGGDKVLKEAFYSPDGDGFMKYLKSNDWQKYVNWMEKNLILLFETESYVFVHGGLDIRRPPSEQEEGVALWARYKEENWYRDYPKMVIHGHTPHTDPVIEFNRLNLDTSRSQRYLRTRLTAAALPNVLYSRSDICIMDVIINTPTEVSWTE